MNIANELQKIIAYSNPIYNFETVLDDIFAGQMPKFLSTDSDLIEAAIILHDEIFYDKKTYADIGTSNIMKRPDGTIVISDPYARFNTQE